MEYVAFKCDSCGCRIEDATSPLAGKVNAGLSPGAIAVPDATGVPLPRRVRALLARPSQNLHFCVDCYAWEHGEDLVDVEGAGVVSHADYQALDDFTAAHNAVIAGLVASRPQAPSA